MTIRHINAIQLGTTRQARLQGNQTADALNQQIGSVASNTGDLGSLQQQLNTFNTVDNGDGSFSRGSPDGTIEQWGDFTIAPTGTFNGSGSWTFALPYANAPNLMLTLVGFAAGTAPNPNVVYASVKSATAFTAIVSCAVPTGGGGSTITNTVTVSWRTIGK